MNKDALNSNVPFRVGQWKVYPDQGLISAGTTSSKIEPKAMAVLVRLANEAGQVVSREQLESSVWPGQLVGYDSLAKAIIKLRKAFDDNSKGSHIIETIPKRGYRLIATVQALESDSGNEIASERVEKMMEDLDRSVSRFPRRKVAASLFLVLAAVFTVGFATLYQVPLEKPGRYKASIAVLPFKNLSADERQEYFSDGMTADLITDLSKISTLSVIARNTVFAYKQVPMDIKQLGQQLGVRYVVEGSVRKRGGRVRISARLIDATTGFNVWAERFDGSLSDVFKLQDEVTDRIVHALQLTLTDKERKRLFRQYTDSVEAYDHFLIGWQYFWNRSRESNYLARESYQKAIQLDKKFARAYANLALTYAYEYLNAWSDNPELAISNANKYAQLAYELDDSLSHVYWALGVTQVYSRDYQSALDTSYKALALDPNYADGYGLLATALNYAGKPAFALEAMETAMRLNPRYPSIYRAMRGEMYFNLRDYQKAIDDFLYALDINPEPQEPRLWLAAAYVYAGDLESAKWEIEQIKVVDDQLSLDQFEKVVPLKDPGQLKHLVDALYLAGLQ